MLDKFKKNWYWLLLLIPIILICMENKEPDNDIWFLLNSGRYVLQNKIPNIEPFTIHENFNFVMQQWLSSVIFWLIYSKIGKYGVFGFVMVISFLLMYVYYKLCYVISEDKKKSVVITAITFSLIHGYLVTRPQLFTYLILLMEILLMELYIKKKNNKYLYFMPLLSLLLINLHSSMWYFQFVFMLPFIFNTINIKKVTRDKYSLEPLALIIIFMIIVGFINPYGYKSMIFVFQSYGIKDINDLVSEMMFPTFDFWAFKVGIGYLIGVIFLLNYVKKFKLDIRHFLFIAGTSILFFMHSKCFPLFIMIGLYCLIYGLKNINMDFSFNNKVIGSLFNGLKIGLCLSLILTLGGTLYFALVNYEFVNYDVVDIVEYMDEHYDKEKVRLFVEFEDGGYTEYMGYKSYMDARAEVFVKKMNGKDDVFSEYRGLVEDKGLFDYDQFMDKYQFTHLIVDSYKRIGLDKYLENNDKYEVVYVQYFDPNTEQVPLRKLYALRSFEN